MDVKSWNVWIVFEHAEDVEGEWTGHCLDFDVVSQGRSLKHAAEMVAEACAMVASEDVLTGREPLHRRAPQEFYDDLRQKLARGQFVTDVRGLFEFEDSAEWVAMQGVVACVMHRENLEGVCEPQSTPDQPLVWTPSHSALSGLGTQAAC